MLKVVQEVNEQHANRGSLLDEIVRDGARQMLAAALQAEVAAYLAAHADALDEAGHRLVVRNGYHAEPGHCRPSHAPRLSNAEDARAARADRACPIRRRRRGRHLRGSGHVTAIEPPLPLLEGLLRPTPARLPPVAGGRGTSPRAAVRTPVMHWDVVTHPDRFGVRDSTAPAAGLWHA